jgi:hypothetical protein
MVAADTDAASSHHQAHSQVSHALERKNVGKRGV